MAKNLSMVACGALEAVGFDREGATFGGGGLDWEWDRVCSGGGGGIPTDGRGSLLIFGAGREGPGTTAGCADEAMTIGCIYMGGVSIWSR